MKTYFCQNTQPLIASTKKKKNINHQHWIFAFNNFHQIKKHKMSNSSKYSKSHCLFGQYKFTYSVIQCKVCIHKQKKLYYPECVRQWHCAHTVRILMIITHEFIIINQNQQKYDI